MTKTEKIANAKKRINELERLIRYWNDSEQGDAKITNFAMKIKNKVAQILVIQIYSLFVNVERFNIFESSYIIFFINRAIKPILKNSK